MTDSDSISVLDNPVLTSLSGPHARFAERHGRVVLAIAAGIQSRGEIPFLHAIQINTGAIRLYESLGFRVHRRPVFVVTRVGSLERV